MADTKLSDLPLGTLGTSTDILVTNGASSQRVKGTVLNHTGDVTGGVNGVLTIADDAVTTDKIANGDVTAAKLAPGVAGEANTVANIGGGSGVYAQNSGTEAQLKTLVGGSNVTLTAAADTITIDAATGGGGEANTVSNIGAGTGIFAQPNGTDSELKSLVGGSNVTLTAAADTITIDAATGGGGEANTVSNIGAGSGIFAQPNGTDSELKSLVGGTNVTLSAGADTITINSTASGGTDNTVSNIGAGAGVFAQRSGDDSELKSLVGGTNVTITPNADTITISASGSGTAEQPFIIECVDVGTDLIPSTSTPVARFYMPYACAANSLATFNLDEAGTGATLVKLDIHKNGASILSTKATIDSGATTSVGAATPMVYSSNTFAAGDKVEIFVDEIGNTTPGTGLIATIFATRT